MGNSATVVTYGRHHKWRTSSKRKQLFVTYSGIRTSSEQFNKPFGGVRCARSASTRTSWKLGSSKAPTQPISASRAALFLISIFFLMSAPSPSRQTGSPHVAMLPTPPQRDKTLPFPDSPPATWLSLPGVEGLEQMPRVSAPWHIHPSMTKDVSVKDFLGACSRLGAEEIIEVLVFSGSMSTRELRHNGA